jgi:hypothetical protein
LNVGEALGLATELFHQNAIFFLEVFDNSLWVSAHPAGDSDEEELELSRRRVENLSKAPVAQSSIWSRLNFLAVHDEGAARAFMNERHSAPMIREKFHVEPTIEFYDSPVIVEN